MALGSLPCWTYFSAALRTFCLLNPKPNAIVVRTPAPGLVTDPFIPRNGSREHIGRPNSHLDDGLPDKANCTTGRHESHGYQGLPQGSVRTSYQGHHGKAGLSETPVEGNASWITPERLVIQTRLA